MEYVKLIGFVVVLITAGALSALLVINQLPEESEMKIVYAALGAAFGLTLAFILWFLLLTEESKKEKRRKFKKFQEKIS